MRLGIVLAVVGTIVTMTICGVVIAFIIVTNNSVATAVLESVRGDLTILRTSIDGTLSAVPPQTEAIRGMMRAWGQSATGLNFTGNATWDTTLSPIGTYQYPFAPLSQILEAMTTVIQAHSSYQFVYASAQSPLDPAIWGDIGPGAAPDGSFYMQNALFNGAAAVLNCTAQPLD
jgi:hypothetical protein